MPLNDIPSRSTYEAYGGIAIGVAMALFPNFWMKSLCLLLLGGLAVDLFYRSTAYRARPHFRWPLIALITFLFLGLECVVYTSERKASRQVKVFFADSPFLSPWKRFLIEDKINKYHDKLAELGIPVSSSSPMIAGFNYNGLPARGAILTIIGSNDKSSVIKIDARGTLNNDFLGNQYIQYSLKQYLGAKDFQWFNLEIALSAYFTCSFSNVYLEEECSYQGDLAKALWRVRETFGADWTDQVVAYGLIDMHDTVSIAGDQHGSNSYIYKHLVVGEMKQDDSGTKLAKFSKIMSEEGFTP